MAPLAVFLLSSIIMNQIIFRQRIESFSSTVFGQILSLCLSVFSAQCFRTSQHQWNVSVSANKEAIPAAGKISELSVET